VIRRLGFNAGQRRAWLATALATLVSTPSNAQEVALSYTAAQALAGQAAYEQGCITCHGANLNDGPLGPPLKGPAFIAKFGGKTADAVFTVMRTTMPTTAPDSLGADTYAALLAFMLQENDIVAGEHELPGDVTQLARMWIPAGGFSFMTFSPEQPARPLHARHGRDARRATGRRVVELATHVRHARLQSVERDR